MARYTTNHCCGHETECQLYGKHTQREWVIRQREKELCPACQKAEYEKKSEGMPTLTGTEKQIAWALEIRLQMINAYDQFTTQMMRQAKPGMEELARGRFAVVRERLLGKTAAAWWIDNRHQEPVTLAPILFKEIEAR